jgi:hypothetical protein
MGGREGERMCKMSSREGDRPRNGKERERVEAYDPVRSESGEKRPRSESSSSGEGDQRPKKLTQSDRMKKNAAMGTGVFSPEAREKKALSLSLHAAMGTGAFSPEAREKKALSLSLHAAMGTGAFSPEAREKHKAAINSPEAKEKKAWSRFEKKAREDRANEKPMTATEQQAMNDAASKAAGVKNKYTWMNSPSGS